MNLLEFEQLMTGANMPRCLQRGALFDWFFDLFVLYLYPTIRKNFQSFKKRGSDIERSQRGG